MHVMLKIYIDIPTIKSSSRPVPSSHVELAWTNKERLCGLARISCTAGGAQRIFLRFGACKY